MFSISNGNSPQKRCIENGFVTISMILPRMCIKCCINAHLFIHWWFFDWYESIKRWRFAYIFELCSCGFIHKCSFDISSWLFQWSPKFNAVDRMWRMWKEREIEKQTHEKQMAAHIYQLNLPQLSISASVLLHKCYEMEKYGWCKRVHILETFSLKKIPKKSWLALVYPLCRKALPCHFWSVIHARVCLPR